MNQVRTFFACCAAFVMGVGISPASTFAQVLENGKALTTNNEGMSSATQNATTAGGAIHFARDIQPILSNHCYACHGPDAEGREAGLRLDDSSTWGEELESGEGVAISVGHPDDSLLIQRVESTDYDQMPPDDFGKPLSDEQKLLLRRWIESGAEWKPHWAYASLDSDQVDALKAIDSEDADKVWLQRWNQQPIDRFLASAILERRKGQAVPNGPADPTTLVRRVHFDLTGLPPNPEVVQQFVANPTEEAYTALVDNLLASPQHAEHMTRYWLDWVRFADTVGYHGDQGHAVWPYRDYVLKSFWENKPFDQFTIEQLAGDLLDNPTEDQLIATAYNRLLQTTHEGGAQDLEYREKYLADRVRNFSEVWLASTLACAQCHDHKYDPLTQNDFYSLGAFFADIDEHGSYDGKAPNATPTLRYPQKVVISPLDRSRLPEDFEQQVQNTVSDRIPAAIEEALNSKTDRVVKRLKQEQEKKKQQQQADTGDQEANPDAKQAEIEIPEVKLTDREESDVRRRLATEVREQLLQQLEIRSGWCMYTKSVSPREIRLLPRGDWMDRSGPVVTPATPEALPPIQQNVSSDNQRLTRLDLAKWLFQNDNPLPARVLANRLWYIAFHKGLSSNLGDFGFQGHWPSHPQLLDYLAQRLVDGGWDVRSVMREIVLSQAYQQSSETNAATRVAGNDVLYLTQSRPRLSAEEIRDNALAVSGLLVSEFGGPSVKPYQPAGYYRSLNFPVRKYHASTGADLYRRGVYVHWQRQFLHPMLKAFDAPTREECTAQRSISNTPSAALVLLNAPEFVEAARALVLHSASQIASADNQNETLAALPLIQEMAKRTLSRELDETEQAVMQQLYQSQLNVADDDETKKLLNVATELKWNDQVPQGLDWKSFYAMTQVARVLLNLDETLTRY